MEWFTEKTENLPVHDISSASTSPNYYPLHLTYAQYNRLELRKDSEYLQTYFYLINAFLNIIVVVNKRNAQLWV